ncbi:MAG: hypothetical protein DLM70_06185 [Chloroflexi bacterium]|nr:MAG: hypothetical protein DLM70_06185 [Chloroflexota bacterium]
MNRVPARVPPELKALAVILGTAVFAAAIVSFATAGHGRSVSQHPGHSVKSRKASAVVPGPFTGLPTASAIAHRRPVAVIIDNLYPDARPQAGLSQASVVIETLVESGITRLMGLFLEHDANRVGPIRSARPYFVRWADGYSSVFVHGGGSPAALNLIKRISGIVDIEALASRPEFTRARDRNEPDNLYSSTQAIRGLENGTGSPLTANFAPLAHKADAPPSARGPGQPIRIDFSTPLISSPPEYKVTYRYEPRKNQYLRADGGEAFVDQLTNRQIETNNVAILITNVAPIPGDAQQRVSVMSVGQGQAIYFRDGKAVRGIWEKRSAGSAIRFLDNNGRDVKFNKGRIWIEVVPPGAVQSGAPP